MKDTFCSYCGTPHVSESYPKICTCGQTTYINPMTVGVALLPVEFNGLVAIRRAIAPKIGELAFPGGFQNIGETVEDCARRECFEETGLMPEGGNILYSRTTGNITLVFVKFNPIYIDDVNPIAGPEAQEVVIVNDRMPLCFPLHTEAFEHYLKYWN